MLPINLKEEVEELFEIRAVLESYALRVISEKISDQPLEKLNGFIFCEVEY